MQKTIDRNIKPFVEENLATFPAVAILGPRQCGKSTLLKMIYSDLETLVYMNPRNRNDLKILREPAEFFQANRDRTICLDEIQYAPPLFPALRVEFAHDSRPGRFILIGSTGCDLMPKITALLTGGVGIIELTPFMIGEIEHDTDFTLNRFWLRGGYPDSYLAPSDQGSVLWRENFIKTYMERDIPRLGFQTSSLQLRRLLTMCAHGQGQLFDPSKLADVLGITAYTIRRYVDMMEQTFIVRSLPSFEQSVKKRVAKASKVYVRDSGLLHRLLQVDDFNSLTSNPMIEASWEGLVIEQIISSTRGCKFSFYRNAAGDEIDLLIEKGDRLVAVECKASTAPRVTEGFWNAIEAVRPERTFVVAPVSSAYPLREDVEVCGLIDFLKKAGL
jgi:predicted AAA+ superfamily ATPase